MTELDVSGLAEAIGGLETLRFKLDSYGGGELDGNDHAELVQHVAFLRQKCCGPLKLKHSAGALERLSNWMDGIIRQRGDMPLHAVVVHIESIQQLLHTELSETRFYGLRKDRAEYYGNSKIFGVDVLSAFPSAKYDITEAMRCFALEVNTAAVFHLMRVAEFGLRVLAYDRRIQIPKDKPLELASWEDIIRQLENSEGLIHGYKATLVREQQFDFYHGAMMEIRRFKNVWRNNIMHSRDEYDRDQAMSVLTHVRAFMQILASRISEANGPLPEVWGASEYRA